MNGQLNTRACALAAALLLTSTPILGDDLAARARFVDEETRLERRAAAHAAADARSVGVPTTSERYAVDTSALFLPYFEVDTQSAAATTLFGIRNECQDDLGIDITYWNPLGQVSRTDTITLGPSQVKTINVRDVGGLPDDPDGFERGFVTAVVVVDQGHPEIAGDFFLVDPAGNFAKGNRMIDMARPFECILWSSRYANGGAFDGGTDVTVYMASPLGGDPGTDPASFSIDAYGEDGVYAGTIDVWTDLVTQKVALGPLLDLLSSAPPFGSFELLFHAGTSGMGDAGGVILVDMTAEDRYSVDFEASCVLPL